MIHPKHLFTALTAGLFAFHCHAQDPLPAHAQVVDAYKANPEQAAKKYDDKRVKVKAVILSYGESFVAFGAVDELGNRFDATFAPGQQAVLAPKLPDGKLQAFKPTTSAVDFDCLNKGFLPQAIVPSIKLVDCKFSK